ncbi:MAG TPA: hypothetical protein VMH39_14595 [Gemmatimonadaceae bacterium]|nr:hypothetical protein [Gemmatimonadaceae bacterium]
MALGVYLKARADALARTLVKPPGGERGAGRLVELRRNVSKNRT